MFTFILFYLSDKQMIVTLHPLDIFAWIIMNKQQTSTSVPVPPLYICDWAHCWEWEPSVRCYHLPIIPVPQKEN